MLLDPDTDQHSQYGSGSKKAKSMRILDPDPQHCPTLITILMSLMDQIQPFIHFWHNCRFAIFSAFICELQYSGLIYSDFWHCFLPTFVYIGNIPKADSGYYFVWQV
jgi:hypothetical protein